MEKLNIYQKMLKITDELQTVAKNLTVQTGKSSYKAVGELDILNAVKPVETKYGVYSYPVHREIIDTAVLESESNGYTRKQLFMRVQTVYRFVNVDKPDESIDITSYGDGLDAGDKATGKAMTYCDKYALMKAYKISTGDDPDQNASEELKTATSQKPKATVPATTKQLQMVRNLYSDAEITKMLKGLHVATLEEITIEQASTMIASRKGK